MRSAWLDIDLDAYRGNLRALAEHSGTPVLAVVKANAYGHGMLSLARAARQAGCAGVAVALPEEGAELRVAGLPGLILVLGLALEEQASYLVEHDLEVVVSREEMLPALAAAAKARGSVARVHVKVDTGMTRVGVPPAEALELCRSVAAHPELRLSGVMTHFASADGADPSAVIEQWGRFSPILEELPRWTPRPRLHAANSAAGVWFPETRLDWVRGGLLTYGVNPGPRSLPFELRPVAALRARVVQVRDVLPGQAVSYGGTWTTTRRSRLALVALGYADGLPWVLSNRGWALIRGARAPIRGRICMDQLVLDATELPDVAVGDTVTFIGEDGNDRITVEEMAELAGTIPYEIMTRWAARIPRITHG